MLNKENKIDSIIEAWPPNLRGVFRQYWDGKDKSTPIYPLITHLTDLLSIDYTFNLSAVNEHDNLPYLLTYVYPEMEGLGLGKNTTPDELSVILEPGKENCLGSRIVVSVIDRLILKRNLERVIQKVNKW